MIRSLALCCASVVTLSAGLAGQGQVQRTVLVTVMPDSGGAARTLTTSDFMLKEGGTPRQVVNAELSTDPLYVSILVEAAQVDGSNFLVRDLRNSVASFVAALRAGEPQVMLGLTEVGGAPVPRLPFGAPAADMDAAVQRLYPSHQGETVIIEGIGEASLVLAKQPTPRRAIVAVDFTGGETTTDRTIKQAGDRLGASGATVWSVSMRPTRMPPTSRDQGLDYFSRVTGGARLTVLESTGLQAQLKRVADALLSQYVVTFSSPYSTGGRPIQVETTKGIKAVASRMVR